MGLQPDSGQLIYHGMFEHKETSTAGFKELFKPLEVLGRGDMAFVNSLVIIITPMPDPISDMQIVDQLEVQMTTLIRVTTRAQAMKTSGTTWITSDGDSPTNPYWTFYGFTYEDLPLQNITIKTALTSWVALDEMRCDFWADIYSVPHSRLPVFRSF